MIDQERSVRPASETFSTSFRDGGVVVDMHLSRLDPYGILPEDALVRVRVEANGVLHSYEAIHALGVRPLPIPMHFLPRSTPALRRLGLNESPLLRIVNLVYFPWEVAAWEDPDDLDSLDLSFLLQIAENHYRSLSPKELAIPHAAPAIRLGRLGSIASNLHNAFWRRVLPHLDAEALRLSRLSFGGVRLYNELCRRPRLKELLATAPIAGVMLAELLDFAPEHASEIVDRLCLEEGVPLREILRRLYNAFCLRSHYLAGFSVERAILGPDPYAPDNYDMVRELAPSFVRWATTLRPTAFQTGMGKRLDLLDLIVQMVRYHRFIPVDLLAHRRTSEQSRLFHLVLASGEQGILPLLDSILREPAAAVRAFHRYWEHPTPLRSAQVSRLVKEIRDTLRDPVFGAALRGSSLSFSRLCRESSRYHRYLRERSADEVIARARQNVIHFPEPIFLGFQDESYTLRWLPTSLDLARESMDMRHCVEGYAEECLRGDSVIYTMRTLTNQIVGTLELSPKGEILQFRGFRNRTPAPAAQRWMRRVIREAFPDAYRKQPVARGAGAAVPAAGSASSPNYGVFGASDYTLNRLRRMVGSGELVGSFSECDDLPF